jgi:hypothetical protein
MPVQGEVVGRGKSQVFEAKGENWFDGTEEAEGLKIAVLGDLMAASVWKGRSLLHWVEEVRIDSNEPVNRLEKE